MATPLPSRGDIVTCLSERGRALHAKEIASRCGVKEAAYPRLLQLLDQLSLDGTLVRVSNNRYKAHPVARGGGQSWEGVLSVHPRGFGFVNAAGHDDVYIAPDGIGAALHGDRVVVRVTGRSSRGTEGRIENIVARRNPRVAGVLRKRRRSAWLEPDDARVRGPIVLAEVPKDAVDGNAAVCEIMRFPEAADENPEGRVVAVLGTPGDAKAEVAKILVREQIDEKHPDEAVREAEAMAAKLARPSPDHRKDLRDVPFLTIDPADARDHDDAVYAERRGDGYRVWVAIADVSEYVQPGSALDQEAKARGVTIYLPDRAVPMLPTALAADLCSLLPDVERLCMCAIIDLDKKGAPRRTQLVEGVMRGAAMITYQGVASSLGFSSKTPKSPQAEAFKRELKVLDEVGRKLRRRRMRRGSLDFDLPEAYIELDEETGVPADVRRRAEDPGVKRAYQLVEELMILANEAVAKWLGKRRCPTIYRVHGKPDEEKIERLGRICEVLGAPFDLDEMLEPLGVSKWLSRIEEHQRRSVLEMMLLRSMKQAVYDIVNIGHFGLASEAYLHFTSPIRRYPDVQVHRGVKHLLRGGEPDLSESAIESLRSSATEASARERAAMEVEREVSDLYRALYMREHIGDVLEGTVGSVVGGGLYVTLDAPFVDVLVRFESMGPDRYELSDDELAVVGLRSGDRIELGDRITVEIEDVAILRRAVYARRVVPDKVLQEIEREWSGRRGRGRRAGRGRQPEGGTKGSSRGSAASGGKTSSGRGSRGAARKGPQGKSKPGGRSKRGSAKRRR